MNSFKHYGINYRTRITKNKYIGIQYTLREDEHKNRRGFLQISRL